MATTLRADAQRNLDRLLESAAECFAERGIDCSVDEIARRAGVGHGTVFRRFPNKEALLLAVVVRRIEALTAVAEEAAGAPDVEAAFACFVRSAAAAYARDRALVEGLDRCVDRPELAALIAAVDRLVRRAHEARVLRAELGAEDVLRLVPTASLYPDVVLDGLKPRSWKPAET
jgi:AcrR family transcriptional regulator